MKAIERDSWWLDSIADRISQGCPISPNGVAVKRLREIAKRLASIDAVIKQRKMENY